MVMATEPMDTFQGSFEKGLVGWKRLRHPEITRTAFNGKACPMVMVPHAQAAVNERLKRTVPGRCLYDPYLSIGGRGECRALLQEFRVRESSVAHG